MIPFHFYANVNSDEKFIPAGRVSMAQSGSLSIFSSREQEYEQRAQLLKRLAFAILCSETDQYHKYMPEIQGELMTSLGSEFHCFWFYCGQTYSQIKCWWHTSRTLRCCLAV